MHPIIIIGSGMAGYTLAREYRKLNSDQAVIMISADDAANYAKPTISNALSANKHPSNMALADADKMAQQLNIQILKHSQVLAIDAAQHQIRILNQQTEQTLDYAKLVLAVGAAPIRLPIAGDGFDDIKAVNSLSDYAQFRDILDQCAQKRVTILGAGLIGCEFANDLQQTGHQITVVDLAPQALGRLLPSHAAQDYQHRLEQIGIEFVLNSTVDHIQKQQDQYLVGLSNGHQVEADLVLSAIGLQPNIHLAHEADIATQRGILTNALLETNQADIYAIGDCAEVNGMLLPYVMPIMQQSRALAKTLNGEATAVHYPAMPVAVKTPAAPLTVLPAPLNIELHWETEQFEDGLLSKALDTEGTLRGFVLLGPTAAKQRLALTKLVPDLLPAA